MMPAAMDKPPTATNVSLEQFLLLAKSAKGAAAAELIKQVTEAPGVYVFGELLDMPSIKEVSYFSLFSSKVYFEFVTNADVVFRTSAAILVNYCEIFFTVLKLNKKPTIRWD